MQRLIRRITLEDVAREAGVSLATADRVVNRRAGVRDKTVRRVEAAIDKLGYRANSAAAALARNRSYRFAFILPSTANAFMQNLSDELVRSSEWLATQNSYVDVLQVDVFDAHSLAEALYALPDIYDGLAVVALDDPRVRDAMDSLVARGIQIVTLVSDAPGSRRAHYVGINNLAAGRTAASLMGRFLRGRNGVIGVLTGSLALRDHAERVLGFRQILSSEFPHLSILPVLEGRDESDTNRRLVTSMLASNNNIVGLYNVGSGNQGVGDAIIEAGRSRGLVWIAHELTSDTRQFLLQGIVEAVINQDPGHEIRSAARLLLAQCTGQLVNIDQERIRIEIFLRDNLY